MYVFAVYVPLGVCSSVCIHPCEYPSVYMTLHVHFSSVCMSVCISPPCVCSLLFYVSLFGCFLICLSTPCIPSVSTSLFLHVPSLCMCSERFNDPSAYVPSACLYPLRVYVSPYVCLLVYVPKDMYILSYCWWRE